MRVRYLSQEWIDAYNDALAGDAVRAAVKGKSATIQMVVSDAPDGEVHYWLRIEDGGASETTIWMVALLPLTAARTASPASASL